MCWKLLHLCVIVQIVGTMECVPYSAIVQLSCAACRLNPNTCCVGTLLAPNLAITTAFCAHSCEYIVQNNTIVPILSTRVHPKSSISMRRSINPTGDDISFFNFNHTTKLKRSYVKISAVEPLSLIGLRSFVPIISDRKVFLKPTVILPCGEQYERLRGFYICSSKYFGEKSMYPKMQGVPLLLNGCLIGISDSTDEHQSLDAFMALAPRLSWIEAAANSNLSGVRSKSVLVNFKAAPQQSRYKKLQRRSQTRAQIYTESSTKSIFDNFLWLEPRYRIIKTSKPTKISEVIDERHFLYNTKVDNMSKDLGTIFKPNKYVLRLSDAKNGSASETSSTTTTSEPTKTFSTNVMEWFRKIKATLSRDPPSLLILTTAVTKSFDYEIVEVDPRDPLPTPAPEPTAIDLPHETADFVDLT